MGVPRPVWVRTVFSCCVVISMTHLPYRLSGLRHGNRWKDAPDHSFESSSG